MASGSSPTIARRLTLGALSVALAACGAKHPDNETRALETALGELEKRTGRTFSTIVLADELDANERQVASNVRPTITQKGSTRQGFLVVPDDHVLLRDVVVAGSSAEVELQIGPSRLPPPGQLRTLDCGSTQRFELALRDRRWDVGEARIRQC